MDSRQLLRIAVTTLGCKVNQFESAALQAGFEARGAVLVPFSQPADIYVVNTCAVTAKAGFQSRQLIRRAAKANPAGRLVVTGCYAQAESQAIIELVDGPLCLVGNDRKHQLVDIALADQLCDLEMHMGEVAREKEPCPLHARRFAGRTRAYLRIQDGCNNFCSYCIVPYVRGRSRSVRPEAVLAQTAIFAQEGYPEVVITGIHTGAYGVDLAAPIDLLQLLQLLDAQAAIPRFRISSLEPTEITPELLRFLAGSDRFLPHFHIPLQSGSPEILRRMHRKYTPATYAETVRAVVGAIPDAGVGADIMAGFPGEDERSFAETLSFLEQLPISYLHVFPYSMRAGTLAAGMEGQVAKRVKEERVLRLRELDHRKRTSFYNRHAGKVGRALIEGRQDSSRLLKGFTDNYIPVLVDGPDSLVGRVVHLRIERIVDQQVIAKLVQP